MNNVNTDDLIKGIVASILVIVFCYLIYDALCM